MSGRRKEHRKNTNKHTYKRKHESYTHIHAYRDEARASVHLHVVFREVDEKPTTMTILHIYFSVYIKFIKWLGEWASKQANGRTSEWQSEKERSKARQNIKTLKRFNWKRVCVLSALCVCIAWKYIVQWFLILCLSFLTLALSLFRSSSSQSLSLALSASIPLLFWECLSWRFF